MTSICSRHLAYADMMGAASVAHTGVLNYVPSRERAAVYTTCGFFAVGTEQHRPFSTHTADYAMLQRTRASCDGASYDLVQPTPACLNSSRVGVYSTLPASSAAAPVCQRHRRAVYAVNPQIYIASASPASRPRPAAIAARHPIYESTCAEMDLTATVAKAGNSTRTAVYAANAELFDASPALDVRRGIHAALVASIPDMHPTAFDQLCKKNAYRTGIYASNPELYSASYMAQPAGYKGDVYTATTTTRISEHEVAENPSHMALKRNYFVISPMSYGSKPAVPSSPAARASRNTRPMASLRRTESTSSLKSLNFSSSISDLTALMNSPTLIRSSSHQDMQALANVSLINIDSPVAEEPASSASRPRSAGTRGVLQRAGHLGSFMMVSRLAKVGN